MISRSWVGILDVHDGDRCRQEAPGTRSISFASQLRSAAPWKRAYPEAAPGPHDADPLFTEFVELMEREP